MPKRFLFYIDGFNKPVTITDPNENRDMSELTTVISEMLLGSDMCMFSTDKDSILAKPVNIKSVCITDLSNQDTKQIYTQSSEDKPIKNIDINLDNIDNTSVKKDIVDKKIKNKNKLFEKDLSHSDSEEDIPIDVLNEVDGINKTPINNVEIETELKSDTKTKPKVVSRIPEKKGEPIIHETRHIVMDQRK